MQAIVEVIRAIKSVASYSSLTKLQKLLVKQSFVIPSTVTRTKLLLIYPSTFNHQNPF